MQMHQQDLVKRHQPVSSLVLICHVRLRSLHVHATPVLLQPQHVQLMFS